MLLQRLRVPGKDYGFVGGMYAMAFGMMGNPGSTGARIIGEVVFSMPFGGDLPGDVRSNSRHTCYPLNPPGVKYTGQMRDGDPGSPDYFGARYFSAAQGRFTSPDEPLLDQYAADPQSWNLYGYVRNNPLRFTDPTGEACKDSRDEAGNPCFVLDVTEKLGPLAKRAVGATTFGLNGLIDLANSFALLTGRRNMDPNLERSQKIPYIEIQDRSGNAKLGEQASQLATVPFILSGAVIKDLLKAAGKLDRNLLSKAGRALQKHGSRPGSAFPAAQGPASAMNQQAEQVLQGILGNPQATTAIRHHARFGNVLEVTAPGGHDFQRMEKSL